MTRMSRFTLVGCLLMGLAACEPGAADDDFSSVEIGLDGKADSQSKPTNLGALASGVTQTHDLVHGKSGFHQFTFTGAKGAHTTLAQASETFRTYLRVTAPSGKRWNLSGVQDPMTGAWRSSFDVTLTEAGRYTVIATSTDNMRIFASARTDGTYTILLGAATPPPPVGGGGACATRTGGALVTFKIAGSELLTLWVTDPTFIAAAKDKLTDGTTQIPMFDKLIDGGDCDSQYSWHVDPALVSFTDFATEVCDGLPSYIEHNKPEWIGNVHNYCPWQSQVISVDARP
jgi:hypothetical protein